MVYEFEYLQRVAAVVGKDGKWEEGNVEYMAWVPICDSDLDRMINVYGESYSECTHWLIFATQSEEYGDTVTSIACASDGSSPYDTPFYTSSTDDEADLYVAFSARVERAARSGNYVR